MAIPFGKVIQAAVKAGGFTANVVERTPKVPSVAVHLAGRVKDGAALLPEAINLNPGLMTEIEAFLASAGVPVERGLKVLKADAAADALVLTAEGLEGSGREVVIKLTNKLGIHTQMPHLAGNALHIQEPMMADAVQTTVKSALNGEPVLVRIEPMMQPADKVLETLPGDKLQMMDKFREEMKRRVNAKGLADIDLKANNFAIARNAPPVKDLDDLLSRDLRIIDPDSIRIRRPEITAQMANPIQYQPAYHPNPPKHIDELFAAKELPALDSASAAPATQQARDAGNKKLPG
jgi:hypothetical protein